MQCAMRVLQPELSPALVCFAEGEKRLKKLEKALGREGIEFRPESYKWSCVQVGRKGATLHVLI